MDKRSTFSTKLDNEILAWITDDGHTLCLDIPTTQAWVTDISDWDMSKFLDFLRQVNSMSSKSVDLAFQYDEQFKEGIEDALSKTRKNKIFDTGCGTFGDLAWKLLRMNAFGELWSVVENSICIKDMANLLANQDWVYRDGHRIKGGYIETPDGIIGYIDE